MLAATATDGGADGGDSLVSLQETLYTSRNPTRRYLHRERFDLITQQLRAAGRPADGHALEVGPGAGPYMEELGKNFSSVVASDIELEYLRHVQSRYGDMPNLTLVVDDITRSALEPESYDVVLCTEVIEHVPDPAEAVGGIFRLLKPGGRLILSTPQSGSTVEVLARLALRPWAIGFVRAIYREPVLPTGHISLLTRREVRGMLEDAGFVIEASRVAGLYLPGLAEIGGERAVRVERRLAGHLAKSRLRGLLWTQYWSAVRPA